MGFANSDLKFLLSGRRLGISGDSICTLGRLSLHLSQRELTAILKEHGEPDIVLPRRPMLFADDVLPALGFAVEAMDASDYEGATIIHDLNVPVPKELENKYDLVWDGGTLEHIYNFPQALENMMRMAKVGGNIAMRTPANNQCGHGFYQFSAELFFRVLTPANGFELVRIYITSRNKHYHVIDPAKVHGRVELLSSEPAFLMVHARKIGEVPAVIVSPQQSDYLSTWNEAEGQDGRLKSFIRSHASKETVDRISALLNTLRQKRAVAKWRVNARLSNRRFYIPVDRWDIPSAQA